MTSPTATEPSPADLEAARRGDETAFERLLEPHRANLQAHCYRMLGSRADAEDAVQEALLRAWRGLPRFEGRSSLRSWLYRIATNVCLKAIERRPRRVLPVDFGPPGDPHDVAERPLTESAWIDPYPDEAVEQRESVELAFVAALQHLPPRQRAVLLLRDVLGFAPAEIATTLGTTAAAVSSALQRAHAAVEERLPERSQQATLRELGDERISDVVTQYMRAWEVGDVPAIVALLTEDATFDMPPRPEWYRGRAAIGVFLAAKPLSVPGRWRVERVSANGQPAVVVFDADHVPHGLSVLALDARGKIAAVTSFLEPETLAGFGLPVG